MNILLIDDDRDDAELFEEILKEIDSSINFEHIEKWLMYNTRRELSW